MKKQIIIIKHVESLDPQWVGKHAIVIGRHSSIPELIEVKREGQVLALYAREIEPVLFEDMTPLEKTLHNEWFILESARDARSRIREVLDAGKVPFITQITIEQALDKDIASREAWVNLLEEHFQKGVETII